MHSVKTALISIFDDNSIVPLVEFLTAMGVAVVATDSSMRFLQAEGVDNILSLADYTGLFKPGAERAEVLRYLISGDIASDERGKPNGKNNEDCRHFGIELVDLLIVGICPFLQNCSMDNIDVFGTSIIRLAAKSYNNTCVIIEPLDYGLLIEELKQHGGKVSVGFSQKMAGKALILAAEYDTAVAAWFNKRNVVYDFLRPRYTEHKLPYDQRHNAQAFFCCDNKNSVFEQLHGKHLDYNALLDVDAAYNLILELGSAKPAAVFFKHGSLCAAALAESCIDAYNASYISDAKDSFGAVVAMSGVVDGPLAAKIIEVFTEAVLAYDFTADALRALQTKKNLRVLKLRRKDPEETAHMPKVRNALNGLVVQEDGVFLNYDALQIATKKEPSAKQIEEMVFAYRVCQYVHSSAIVLVKDFCAVGIGAGQTNAADSLQIALNKAGQRACGSVMAVVDDGASAFEEYIEIAAKAGIVAIVQHESTRCDKLVKKADEHSLIVAFVGNKHFGN